MNIEYIDFKKALKNKIKNQNKKLISDVIAREIEKKENESLKQELYSIVTKDNISPSDENRYKTIQNHLLRTANPDFKIINFNKIPEEKIKIDYAYYNQIIPLLNHEILYSTITHPTVDNHPKNYDTLKNTYLYIDKFQDNYQYFQNNKILLIKGPQNAGKTYLMHYLISKIIANTDTYQYIKSFDLINIFKEASFFNDNENYERLLNDKFLFIDDLGQEPIYKNITIEYLANLLEKRQATNKLTVIATSQNKNNIDEYYGELISERLFNEYNALVIDLK